LKAGTISVSFLPCWPRGKSHFRFDQRQANGNCSIDIVLLDRFRALSGGFASETRLFRWLFDGRFPDNSRFCGLSSCQGQFLVKPVLFHRGGFS